MKNFQKLSETEMELMQVIWECDHPVTSSELLSIFARSKGKEWKGQTIATFLARLVDKGVLVANKQGRSNTYVPHLSHKEYKQSEAQSILNMMYQGSIKNFLSALYNGNKVSKEEIAELKQWFSGK
ncbi:BlaI/MecI/CopY family transcriptional regulator [Paenibacillus alvei]|uniref:BlaI/MecI/CopY family transcriptional regulator n=1 Tax=Paenibacillus alvei TaxID=44250 RepID=A0ABT4H3G2_PAEAL|nr:BlaI/MecI/CopY family transcriptional regulator [Paenibacillus alvei]MCY9763511.1 BlaI/MecI/CopY family transcriptional regulator [Paenibacillus alvei]MCY9767477.1 BlaI/MecI/CopY family transcriptional regulator [Paenibacillus alvei]